MFFLLSMAAAADPSWPRLVLSATNMDFGLVPLGEIATQTVTVTNTGDMPMGLAVDAAGWPSGAFSASIEADRCDDGAAFYPIPASTEASEPPEVILPAGCTVTLTASYAPFEGALGRAGLRVAAVGAYPHGATEFQTAMPAFAEDPYDFIQYVELTGTSTGEPSTNSEPVVLAVDLTHDVCHEGETVDGRVIWFDPDGQTPSVQWGADDPRGAGLFDNVLSATVVIDCPAQDECLGSSVVVYALVNDPDGHQAWARADLVAIDEERGLIEPFDPDRSSCLSGEDTAQAAEASGAACGCGCGGGDSGGVMIPFALTFLLSARRGSRPGPRVRPSSGSPGPTRAG